MATYKHSLYFSTAKDASLRLTWAKNNTPGIIEDYCDLHNDGGSREVECALYTSAPLDDDEQTFLTHRSPQPDNYTFNDEV